MNDSSTANPQRAAQLFRLESPFSKGDSTADPALLSPEQQRQHLALQTLRHILTADLEDGLLAPNAQDAAASRAIAVDSGESEEKPASVLSAEEEIEAWRFRVGNLLEMYRLRERHFAATVHRKDLEQQLLEAKLKHQLNAATQEALRSQAYKEQITGLGKTERALRQQLSTYAEKFEQFQVTLTKSNDVFTTFKQEMQKMTKTIQKLERENASLRKKAEQAEGKAAGLMEERGKLQKDLNTNYQRTAKLEQICRALQNERKLGLLSAQAVSPAQQLPEEKQDPPQESS